MNRLDQARLDQAMARVALRRSGRPSPSWLRGSSS
jgi:hypothetical protein